MWASHFVRNRNKLSISSWLATEVQVCRNVGRPNPRLPNLVTPMIMLTRSWKRIFIPNHYTGYILPIHFRYAANVTVFPTAVTEFKMSRLILSQRIFVIEFMIKHDSNKDCRIQFNKTFFLELKESVRQVVSSFLCDDVHVRRRSQRRRSEIGSHFYLEYVFDVRG